MLSITLALLTLGLSPETGLYVSGEADKAVLEKAVLIEELQARLPGLQVTTIPTQNQGQAYTLTFSQRPGDQQALKLLFILKDAKNNILLKRSLTPGKQTLATARQIALVIEGVIKRRGDALSEILLAQKPEPEPEPVVNVEPGLEKEKDSLQLDAAITFGTLLESDRSTVGLQMTAQQAVWRSLYLGLQGGFQHLLPDGKQESNAADIGLFEWTAVGLLKWQYRNQALKFSVLSGAGIAVAQTRVKDAQGPTSFRQSDTLLLLRVALDMSWKISNQFSMLGGFTFDFTPKHPSYEFEGEELLKHGSSSIFASLGFRYSPF